LLADYFKFNKMPLPSLLVASGRFFLLATFLFLEFPSQAFAQVSGEKVQVSTEKLLTGLLAFFKPINSIKYSLKKELIEGSNAGAFTVDYTLAQSADGKFKCEWRQKTSDGQEVEQNGAFDGTQWQSVQPSAPTRLFISKGLPNPSRLVLSADEFLLSPFRFVSKITDSMSGPDLKILKDPKTYTDLQSRVISIGSEMLEGKDCFAIKFRSDDPREAWKVYLCKDLLDYPILWQRLNESGNLIASYEVTKVGHEKDAETNDLIPFPEEAIGKYYSVSQGGQNAVSCAYRYSITNCAINALDEDAFIFDPALVDGIYDEDNKILIQVPK